TPLSEWGRPPRSIERATDAGVDMKTPPKAQVEAMAADQYFAYATEVLKANRPHLTDEPILARMQRIGIEPGKSFNFDKAPAAVRAALEAAPANAQRLMDWKLPTLARVANHWSMNTDTMGVYGNYYLKRTIIAQSALGANVPEDAIYPVNLGDQTGTKTRFTPTRVRSRHRAGPVHTRRPLKGAVTMRKRTTIACTTL